MKILVTGGCGFIGSAVVRHLIRNTDHEVINVDKMTYAANVEAIEEAKYSDRHHLVKADISDMSKILEVFFNHNPDAVMHLAAESHVDRSISGPAEFIKTNVVGTFTMLEAARSYYEQIRNNERKNNFRFHHISTDEVFGALEQNDPPFNEDTRYDPRSPYSASKAGSDHLVRAWHHTYGLPTIISNTTNNYGPWQFPEKLIPLVIAKALKGEKIPVYGNGQNMRDWLYVEDHAVALVNVVTQGRIGATYAIGARQPRKNIDVVKTICKIIDDRIPDSAGSRDRLIEFVTDRVGHDFRYEIDPSRSEKELEWKAKYNFERGIADTIDWYLNNSKYLDI